MGEINCNCDCDPLYKLIESLADRILLDNFENFDSSSVIQTSVPYPFAHSITKLKDYDSKNCTECESTSKASLLRYLFRERCIKKYTASMLRGASNESIAVTFPWNFVNELPGLWRNLLQDWGAPVTPQIELSTWNIDNLRLCDESLIETISLPPGKYENMQINLSPSVKQHIIIWTVKNFPRKIVRKESCRIENCRVSIGASEISEFNGNTPLAQYRKFVIAKFIVRAFGKSGYIVDPNQFYTLPSGGAYTNDLFIVSEGLYREQLVQRIPIGRVTAKHILPQETKLNPGITIESLHNLRLKGVKVMDDPNEKLSKAENDMDLSWLISAANLTSAKMNYDLLIKDPNSDIELLAVERQENSGIFLIMYNYSRIVSIMNKFQDAVSKEEYPPLPQIEILDFATLCLKEELDLLRFIWEWPRVIERTVDFLEQKLNISLVLKSMKEFAVRFNGFYIGNKVLVPANSSHIFDKMYARIYMLQACRNVFEEFLDIMQIEFNGSAGPTTP